MSKKLEISHSINLFNEAFILLYYWANVDEFEKTKEEYINKYQGNIENYLRKFNLIIEIYHDVKNKLKSKEEKIKYLFKERNSGASTFATLAMLWDQHNYKADLMTYEERFQNVTEVEKIVKYTGLIDFELADHMPAEKLVSLQDLIQFIEASPYEKEEKWEAIAIFNYFEKYYNEVYDILVEVIEQLKNYKIQLDELGHEFYDYWYQYEKNGDLIKTIEGETNIVWNYSEEGIILVPLIFYPFSITLSCDDVANRTKDVIQLSILLDDRLILSNKKFCKEDVINFGKLLCDKSKIDILEYLGKRSAYGKEIADELNLTTATISYHVKTLQASGFLNTTVDSNKVYYSLNREGISSYMDGVKKYFNEL